MAWGERGSLSLLLVVERSGVLGGSSSLGRRCFLAGLDASSDPGSSSLWLTARFFAMVLRVEGGNKLQ